MPNNPIHIAAAGNWIVDKVKRISHYPEQDSLALILNESLGNGGAPFNVLVDLARLECGFALSGIGQMGDDAEGDWIIERCQAYRIDTKNLTHASGAKTSYTDVMTDDRNGRRTFFYAPASNANLALQSFPDIDISHLHYGYIGLLPAMDAVRNGSTSAALFLQSAKQKGVTVSVDLVSVSQEILRSALPPVLPHTDILFMNELEAQAVTGTNYLVDGTLNADVASEALSPILAQMPTDATIVLHASTGALALSQAETYFQRSLKIPKSVIAGASGAGDAFAAGVLAARLGEGAYWQNALLTGVCVAAASLRHATCSEGVENLAGCRALAATFGFV